MVVMHCTYVSALWWGLSEVGGGGRFSHEGMVVVAVQEPFTHTHIVYLRPSGRFQSGSTPSPVILCFGRTCMQMRLSLVRLDHFPLNQMRHSNETSSNRQSSHGHGRHGLCETYRGSRSN
jgi:hypothetical protein